MNCKRQFLGRKRLNNEQLWQEYTQGKQTYAQLAKKHQCSIRTIQRHLDKVSIHQDRQLPDTVNVIMDTTYFGRQFGLMLFIDNTSKVVLHYMTVHHETNLAYQQGIVYIQSQGIEIKSITYDGRRGLKDCFATIPVQMCQFHQLQIVTRYLTRRPKNIASISLRQLASGLTTTALSSWVKSCS